jgi:hypothetical protein
MHPTHEPSTDDGRVQASAIPLLGRCRDAGAAHGLDSVAAFT